MITITVADALDTGVVLARQDVFAWHQVEDVTDEILYRLSGPVRVELVENGRVVEVNYGHGYVQPVSLVKTVTVGESTQRVLRRVVREFGHDDVELFATIRAFGHTDTLRVLREVYGDDYARTMYRHALYPQY